MTEYLFEGVFEVTGINPDGKKFDKVSRIEAHSEQFDMDMQLDVATHVYPMATHNKFTMVLTATLNLDGTPDTGYFTQAGRQVSVCHAWEALQNLRIQVLWSKC
uniref:Pco144871 n=1 Tax=Arundo donax TaxID=35708 RepID=A0A0A9GQQ1_ARUDO